MKSSCNFNTKANTYVTPIKVKRSCPSRQVNIVEKLTKQNWLILSLRYEKPQKKKSRQTDFKEKAAKNLIGYASIELIDSRDKAWQLKPMFKPEICLNEDQKGTIQQCFFLLDCK